ncbi:MAG TPA: hypothetical protein VHO91_05540 [Rhodopila sp.]|nr:hypothetical protein [Rhodopila sp.]
MAAGCTALGGSAAVPTAVPIAEPESCCVLEAAWSTCGTTFTGGVATDDDGIAWAGSTIPASGGALVSGAALAGAAALVRGAAALAATASLPGSAALVGGPGLAGVATLAGGTALAGGCV